MPAYLVAVYRCPDRANAEQVKANFDPGDFSVTEYDTEIHDTPPVVLAGLVRGGEYQSAEDFYNRSLRGPWCLFVAADGRAVGDSVRGFEAAEARGALPITWYRYPEAP